MAAEPIVELDRIGLNRVEFDRIELNSLLLAGRESLVFALFETFNGEPTRLSLSLVVVGGSPRLPTRAFDQIERNDGRFWARPRDEQLDEIEFLLSKRASDHISRPLVASSATTAQD